MRDFTAWDIVVLSAIVLTLWAVVIILYIAAAAIIGCLFPVKIPYATHESIPEKVICPETGDDHIPGESGYCIMCGNLLPQVATKHH